MGDPPGSPRPRITVASVVESAGRFLLVEERIRGVLVLNQPAGHLDPGEDLADAAVRETLEDTGWQVEPTALVAIHQWRSPEDQTEFVRFCFAARPLSHDPERPLDSGIERALWLTRDELAAVPDRTRSPLVLRAVDDFLAAAHWPLDLLRRIDSSPG